MKKCIVLVLWAVACAGCSTLTASKATKMDKMEHETLQQLKVQHDGLTEELASAKGYMVVEQAVLKVPVIGGGKGGAVIVDNRTKERIYAKVSRFDVGGGWGMKSFHVLLVFEDEKLLERAKKGTWTGQVGAEASAGNVALEGSSAQEGKGCKIYTLAGASASATFTVRAVRLKPYVQGSKK